MEPGEAAGGEERERQRPRVSAPGRVYNKYEHVRRRNQCNARTAGVRASASITARGPSARTAGVRASARITARGASARTAEARPRGHLPA